MSENTPSAEDFVRMRAPETALTRYIERNAALLSAAPALLHVAEMIRDADDDCEKDGLPRIPAAARKAIDDAIAKAKKGGE